MTFQIQILTNHIRDYMIDKNINKKEMARRLHISESMLTAITDRKTSIPTDLLATCCTLLKVEPGILFR